MLVANKMNQRSENRVYRAQTISIFRREILKRLTPPILHDTPSDPTDYFHFSFAREFNPIYDLRDKPAPKIEPIITETRRSVKNELNIPEVRKSRVLHGEAFKHVEPSSAQLTLCKSDEMLQELDGYWELVRA